VPALPDRRVAARSFVEANGWAEAACVPLAGDASFRRYFRLTENGRRAVLMDAQPPHERVAPFLRIARHLHGLGLSAPQILAADENQGFLLLEDFGDDTFTRLLVNGTDEGELYAMAADVLIHLHLQAGDAVIPPDLPAYDEGRLLDEAVLLVDWFLPAVRGRPTSADEREDYIAAWRAVFPVVHGQTPTLVLRDFHVDNLMRLAHRTGIAACGLLDFQDAVSGPGAYDLMSLLEDARRDVSDDLRRAMLDRYLGAIVGADDREAFAAAFAVLAAQRHAKVIGIFTRLCRRDGKPVYLVHIPRVWRLLTRALAHPVLAPVTRWLDRYVPPVLRIAPTP
jgi:aminoglycoside/choline kinase family phosphotransferase